MNQNSKITSINVQEEQKKGFFIKLIENKTLLLNITLTIILFGLLIGFINHKMNKLQSKNASMAYASLDQYDQLGADSDIQKLTKIAKKHSFLRPHLDAPLVQECLNQGDVKTAKVLYKRVERRVKPRLHFLFAFNQISLLISEKKYEEALKLSYQLNSELDPALEPNLYSYHLLRIATLEKELGNITSYKERVSDFISFKDLLPNQGESLRLGTLSLSEFITQHD